jgi:hypothetical protein
VTAAVILLWAVRVKKASTNARAPSDTYSSGISARSANLPPMRLPADHAQAKQDQQPGDGCVGEAGGLGHHRCDVGDRGENATEAENGHRHREQNLRVTEGGQFVVQPYAFGHGRSGTSFAMPARPMTPKNAPCASEARLSSRRSRQESRTDSVGQGRRELQVPA